MDHRLHFSQCFICFRYENKYFRSILYVVYLSLWMKFSVSGKKFRKSACNKTFFNKFNFIKTLHRKQKKVITIRDTLIKLNKWKVKGCRVVYISDCGSTCIQKLFCHCVEEKKLRQKNVICQLTFFSRGHIERWFRDCDFMRFRICCANEWWRKSAARKQMFSFSHQNSFTECQRIARQTSVKNCISVITMSVMGNRKILGMENVSPKTVKLKYPWKWARNDFQARLSINPTQMVASLCPPADDLWL